MRRPLTKAALASILFAGALLAVAVIVEAQQAKKFTTVGFVALSSRSTLSPRIEGLRQGLHDLGYVEGKNIIIEYRFADEKFDRLPELAAELVRLKVDIIVVSTGDVTIQAAKNATKTIPIVMMGQGTGPVRAGFVESLARPGGNVTGLTRLGGDLGGKRLERLKEAVPKLS